MFGKSKKIVYLFPVIIAGIAGLLIYGNPKSETSLPTGGREVIVELTEDGFEPSDITITKGTVVKFITSQNNFFWPASNLHPTHDIYPEFDPKEPLAPEESWSFKFDEPGEWKYHDHLAPYFTGVIKVIENETVGPQSNCTNNSDSLDCFQEKLFSVLDERGVPATFDLLAKLYIEEPRLPTACHFVTHNIGLASYKLFMKDKESVISPNTVICASGFFHGFMEAFLTANYDAKGASAFCHHVGEKLGVEAPDAELQCFHGIGHGTMDVTIANKKLWGNDKKLSEPALKFCEEASEKEEELYRCVSGVFNAIANFYITGEYNILPDPLDPLTLCHNQPENYKESCYGNMNSILFVPSKDKDILASAKYIEKIPEDKYAIPAIRYLAGLSSIYLAKKNPEKSIADCRLLQKRLILPCIEGLAHGFLEHGTPLTEYADALSFCRNDYLNSEERDICLRYVASHLGGWYSEEKTKSICPAVEKEYQKYCSK